MPWTALTSFHSELNGVVHARPQGVAAASFECCFLKRAVCDLGWVMRAGSFIGASLNQFRMPLPTILPLWYC